MMKSKRSSEKKEEEEGSREEESTRRVMGDENEELDPRIQVELEKLNSYTDVINKLELDLDEARGGFRSLWLESTREMEILSKRCGASVGKARPYYEARMEARRALLEAQRAASRFEKASGALEAAKEMVTLAEEGFEEKGIHFDAAWQEMLNHATRRVNESEKERNSSAEEHRTKSSSYQISERKVQQLQKSLKRSIQKSKTYFENKAKFQQMLDDQKRQVQLIEETILMTKLGYSESLRELEKISEEIHLKRRAENLRLESLGVREAGVGAEEVPDGREDVREIIKRKLRSSVSVVSSHEDNDFSASNNNNKSPKIPENSSLTLKLKGERTVPSPLYSNGAMFKAQCSTDKESSTTSSNVSPSYEILEHESSSSSDMEERSKPGLVKRKTVSHVQFIKIADETGDGCSDNESLNSMEVIDDAQIDQLMKEEALKDTIEEILSPHS